MKEIEDNKYYVYIYLDPRKPGYYEYNNLKLAFEPMYVGKGQGNRINKHLNNYFKKDFKYKTKFYNVLNKIVKEGKDPIKFKLLENLSDLESKNKEREFIKNIGRLDLKVGPLMNLTDGGEGVSNHIPSKLQRTHCGLYKKGYVISKEVLEKRRLIKIGTKLTKAHRVSCSRAKGGVPILQYSLKGEFIKEWEIMNDCVKAGFKSIRKAFILKSRMSYGYLWIKKINESIPLIIEPYKPSNKTLNKYKNIK